MASPSIPVAAEPHRGVSNTLVPFILFCLGHFCVDFYSGALGALQPLLVERFHLSFTQAGILGGTLVFSSSVLQPVYGYLSDRFHSRMFAALAPAMTGGFIAALGLAHGYSGLLVLVFMGGVGVASFHPQAAANAVARIRENRGQAMAVFICSGSLGLAVGPAFFSALTGSAGLDRLLWGALPGVVLTVIFLRFMPQPVRVKRHTGFDWTPLRAVWKPMTVLFLLVFVRSIVQIVFTQFLPLYLHSQRNYSVRAASWSLSAYLLGGTLGGLAGGSLAGRLGCRRIVLISMLGSVPFLVLFLFTQGVVSAVALFLSGVLLLLTLPVNVVMAQELAPTQAGTVSALMMGFAWGTAGMVFIPLTGWISDAFSMQAAFAALIFFPLLGFLLALRLPAK